MANERAGRDDSIRKDPPTNSLERNSSVPNDLPDSPDDREKLQPTETTIDLPDVKDIPGQEFINAPTLGELADTTISSADEEGAGIFGDEERGRGSEGDVRPDERHTLERTDSMPTRDEENLQRASMDNVDFDGEPLNEKGFGETRGDTVSDEDLDITNETDNKRTSSIADDDEENQSFSLRSADNDNGTEGTP